MSMNVNNTNPSQDLLALFESLGAAAKQDGGDIQKILGSLPTVGSQSATKATSEIPDLVAPSPMPLSLESLVQAIGYEQRKISCQSGIASIEAKGEKQAAQNEKQLEELKVQIEELAKQEALGPFKKAFQWIGAILGVIGAALGIAFGAVACATGVGAAGGACMIVGGVIGLTMALDNLTSVATNGEKSIGAAIQESLIADGHSEEYAANVTMGLSIAFSIVSAALSLGGGIANAVKGAATTMSAVAQKAVQVGQWINTGVQALSGANSIVSGGIGIAEGVSNKKVMDSQATMKEIEAIIEQILFAIDMEKAFVESEMEKANALLEAVSSIVDSCAEAQATILTGTPSIA